MRGNRAQGTRPERRVRSLLHARGLRYRVSVRPIPSFRRTADLVFRKAQLAVFVDGCYWHGCPDHYRPAAMNATFWRTKIGDNKRRDAETNRVLLEHGWIVFRCWEHENPTAIADRIISILQSSAKARL
ncbi:very short patch repair endonuclease [Micromonospora sp. NPDC048843]|uniref:very short patch repair endonuclease n=1 Tax=Micromonospora sp. NPDC048843 TaxID=3155389 RepID=UPI0033E951FD